MKKNKKANKRIIALILAIVTIFSVFAMTTVSAYAGVLQETYPISKYPNNTYYTTDGNDCTSSHKHCITYDNSSQCMAFAKYATDVYAHRSSFSYIDGDTDYTVKSFKGDTDTAKTIMKNIPSGAYVRVTGKSGYSSHSFVLISVSDTEVKVYDANYLGYCKVGTHKFTYSDLITRYSNVSVVMAHKFTKYSNVKNNVYDYTKYHKAACSSSGCKGYKYEAHTLKTTHDGTNHIVSCTRCGYSVKTANTIKYTKLNSTYHTVTCSACDYSVKQAHYAKTTGTNVKCLGCGYVGTINSGTMNVGDETASAADEIASIGEGAVIEENVTIPIDDETVTADDVNIPEIDETVTADDETVTADDEAVTADNETVTADDEAVTADNETVTVDDETVSIENIIN